MPISLDYAQTRALAKKFREITGREVPHGQILSAIASVVGMPMDGLMHKLKSEGKSSQASRVLNPWDDQWSPGGSLLKSFDTLPSHPSVDIPDFDAARSLFETMIRTAPRRTHYAFVLVQIDNLGELDEDGDTANVLVRLSRGLRRYVEEYGTLAACTRRGEFVVLLDDVDPMDEEDQTLGWFSKALPIKRLPDEPEVLITAVVTDVELEEPTAYLDLGEIIEAGRESLIVYNEMRSRVRFVWGPSAY